MVERVLLVVNRSAGTGCGEDLVAELKSALAEALGGRADLRVEAAGAHPQVKALAQKFLAASRAPAAVIAGGGGGTLRAVIEGLCEGSAPGRLPPAAFVCVSALRMGSGNVVARQFGIPLDPREAIRAIAASLQAGRTAPCCVMRCQIGKPQGQTETRYAVTMCGLGQFGRTSGDLARWHRRWPRLRRFAARVSRVEKLNNLEYGLAMLIRSLWCAFRPRSCETVEVRSNGQSRNLRLFAGAVLSFPIRILPFDPKTRIEEEALSLHMVPFRSRLQCLGLWLAPERNARRIPPIRIGANDCVEIRLSDRDSVEFFLDEDPERAYGWLRIQVAGVLAFVPGSGYRQAFEEAPRS